jgi:hypothetical protein
MKKRMAKDKKKSIGIKTTRYFTKTCSKCKFEYPNWFTNCPKCGAAWDDVEESERTISGEIPKKTIKIVVKITEEDFDESIKNVKLVFSADQGNNWYQMSMENKKDYFIAEIAEVPIGSTIIYYIEVLLQNDEIVTENNEGSYFYYKVGTSIEQDSIYERESNVTQTHPPVERSTSLENETTLSQSNEYFTTDVPKKKDYFKSKESQAADFISFNKHRRVVKPTEIPKYYEPEDNLTIFGKPQTEIDPNLKLCPYCNSRIKKEWSTCPICGKDI